MRRLSKRLFVAVLLMVCVILPGGQAQAAARPGSVRKLTVDQASETSATLSWTKVADATGYFIYRHNPKTEESWKIAKTTGLSYTVKKLKVDKEYSFQVYAYRKVGGKTYMSEEPSNVVTTQGKLSEPDKVKGAHLATRGDRSLFLAWNKASNVDEYIIYQYDEESGEYEELDRTTALYYQAKDLTPQEQYSFQICGCRKAGNEEEIGKPSKVIKGTAKQMEASAIHGRYWNATTKVQMKAVDQETGKSVTLKKGEKLITNLAWKGAVLACRTDGSKVKVTNGSKLKYGNLYTSPYYDYYSKYQLESYVNDRKDFTSPTRYLVWVSQYTLSVNVFQGSAGSWKLIKRMSCIVGKNGKTTPGLFHMLRTESVSGRPQIYFSWNPEKNWGNSFHCRIDSNTRGAVSNGCVRLADADLYYLARTCPMGTTVYSY